MGYTNSGWEELGIPHPWPVPSHPVATPGPVPAALQAQAQPGCAQSLAPARQSPYLRVEFVVTQIQRCIDWFERFKVNVDFLLFSFFCHNCSTVNNQTIWRYYK